MTYQVYMLENDKGRRYIGLSQDPMNRLIQHNNGESRWTSKYRPWHLSWTSRAMSLSEARKLENRLKRQKGGDGMNALLRDFGS